MLRMPPVRPQRSRRRRLWLRALSAAGVVLTYLVATAGPAAAHTQLVSSTPAAGASVTEVRSLELRFSEGIEVAASHVWIEDDAGFLELSPATPGDDAGASLSVPVPPLGDGTYAVTWHVLADDGAPAQGTFSFTIAAADAAVAAPPATPADPAADFPPDTSLAIPVEPSAPILQRLPSIPDHNHLPGDVTSEVARGLLDASLSTLVGGLAFVAAVWPQGARLARTRQVLWLAALLAAFTSFELAAFQHAAASGLSTAQALSPWHQWDALQFRFGRIAAARMAPPGAECCAHGPPRTRRVEGHPVGGVVHRHDSGGARAGRDPRAPRALVGVRRARLGARLLHVLGVSIWIGGLVMLLCVVVPRRRVDELLAVMPRFSALATGAVAVLTAGGLVLAVDLVGTAGALPSTGYGRLLLAKVATVGLLLAAASRSRRHVRASLSAPNRLAADSVVRPLALWVGTEVGLVTVVLGLTALLVSRIPPG